MTNYQILEKTQTQTNLVENYCDSIVLLVDSLEGSSGKSYDKCMLGESMYNWVARACPNKPLLVNLKNEADLFDTLKPMLKDAEYTLVLYSDTPLITASAVNQILDFVANKNLSVCKLARGWVFKTEYLKNATQVYALNTYDICANDMFVVNTIENFVKATNILQNRVIKYHLKNGVNISSPANTYIECSVAIETGATIEAFAKLEGTTTIGANSKVCSHATITDSKIDENAIIKAGSVVVRSAVLDNAIVGNNCVITNKSVVGEGAIVSANSVLDGTTAAAEVKIGASCTLINTKIAANVNIGACTKGLGSDVEDVKVGGGATIGNNCVLCAGVYIKNDCTLKGGKVAKRD